MAFNPALGRGVYGIELQKDLRRQADILKHTLWDLKIRAPIRNRIASGMALVNWGAEDGVRASKASIMIGDCYPLGSHSFESFRVSGDKTEDHGRPPSTVHMFAKMARQQSRLYAAVYGSEHLNERLDAIDRMSETHDECPGFSAASFLSETWKRMVYQYDACIAEGIHYVVGKYDEGVTLGKVKRYALAPDAKQGDAWRFTPIFDFDSEVGFWRSVTLVEINQERQRRDINSSVAERGKTIPERRKKKDETRVGGGEENHRPQYPIGGNMSLVERKAGYTHMPLDKNGNAICYNHSAHSGCNKGGACLFPHTQRIRPEGLRWTAQYDLARRGGLLSQKRIESGAVDGYLQALRRQGTLDVKKSIDEGKNTGRMMQTRKSWSHFPPGLIPKAVDLSAECKPVHCVPVVDVISDVAQIGVAQKNDGTSMKEAEESAASSTPWPNHLYSTQQKWHWHGWAKPDKNSMRKYETGEVKNSTAESEIVGQTGLIGEESECRSEKVTLAQIAEEEENGPEAVQIGKGEMVIYSEHTYRRKTEEFTREYTRYRMTF